MDSWPKDALGPFPPEGSPRAHDCRTLPRLSKKGLHSIGQVGEGRQNEEERQLLALSQALGFGTGFWHCLRVSLGLGG